MNLKSFNKWKINKYVRKMLWHVLRWHVFHHDISLGQNLWEHKTDSLCTNILQIQNLRQSLSRGRHRLSLKDDTLFLQTIYTKVCTFYFRAYSQMRIMHAKTEHLKHYSVWGFPQLPKGAFCLLKVTYKSSKGYYVCRYCCCCKS